MPEKNWIKKSDRLNSHCILDSLTRLDLSASCRGKVHSLNSGKVSIQIQLKALRELSKWTPSA